MVGGGGGWEKGKSAVVHARVGSKQTGPRVGVGLRSLWVDDATLARDPVSMPDQSQERSRSGLSSFPRDRSSCGRVFCGGGPSVEKARRNNRCTRHDGRSFWWRAAGKTTRTLLGKKLVGDCLTSCACIWPFFPRHRRRVDPVERRTASDADAPQSRHPSFSVVP